ncbi:CLI_3235 family bacteriocin precursor [Ruminiclostridium sufflavum]
MKRLGKKINTKKETLQAYLCECACIQNCIIGVPDFAPQITLISGNRA